MTLDGTFYIENGVPYMVYAHEWIQLIDGNMEAVQMTPDLSASVGPHCISSKHLMLHGLINGALLLTLRKTMSLMAPNSTGTRNGKLLMLWSSYDKGSYVEALAALS